MSLVWLAVAIVAIAGIAALVRIALRRMEIQIPDWVIQVFWVVVVVVVVIIAILFVAEVAGMGRPIRDRLG